ncbi:anthranilate phosphoribosyltransferase [Parvularcula maris]|uniref:Anthranilate phosphoribosyltransferase n=1 Tax=Parvularcula maris TaxID=2965077 RepID=A0A9X2L778_9PROT|nr:anthranilate phosphoribosyltransferase [Parvularcula maris]MCQ8184209.1 anthranilate phosphoribosyltransferase [Parvularcula maris]
MSFKATLEHALTGAPLPPEMMAAAMEDLFAREVPPEQAAAFLTALRVRGETAEELLAAVRYLKSKARLISSPPGTIDTCGTGGDGADTYNISTATALVVAGAGAPVAKHGNRAVSSASGSSDVLSRLGVDLTESVETQERRLAEDGIAFLFAPNHHPAMVAVAPVRKALGFRTLFNMLGPLMNPAQAKRQLIGVYDERIRQLFAKVLIAEGAERAWVVAGADGLDELSPSGENLVTEVSDGSIRELTVHPSDAGLDVVPVAALKGGDVEANAKALRALLDGEKSGYRTAVMFNAAAGLVLGGKAADLKEGAERAAAAIDSGAAREKLYRLTRKLP